MGKGESCNNDNADDNDDDDEEEKEDPMIISIEYNDYQGSAGIKYSYTVELPDSLNGKHRSQLTMSHD